MQSIGLFRKEQSSSSSLDCNRRSLCSITSAHTHRTSPSVQFNMAYELWQRHVDANGVVTAAQVNIPPHPNQRAQFGNRPMGPPGAKVVPVTGYGQVFLPIDRNLLFAHSPHVLGNPAGVQAAWITTLPVHPFGHVRYSTRRN